MKKHEKPHSKKTHYFITADLLKLEEIARKQGIPRTTLVNGIIGRYLKSKNMNQKKIN